MPDWYTDKPELALFEDFYLDAFYDLSTCRQVGMGVGPIPYTAIIQYGMLSNLDRDMLQPFAKIIMRMDNTFLDWTARELERKSPKTKKNKGPKPTVTREHK